jgi:hypothetical protein
VTAITDIHFHTRENEQFRRFVGVTLSVAKRGKSAAEILSEAEDPGAKSLSPKYFSYKSFKLKDLAGISLQRLEYS